MFSRLTGVSPGLSSSTGDGAGALPVSPGAATPAQAQPSRGPGGACLYSCSCHMLQVKVRMLGWIPLITQPVSVHSHS